VAPKVPSWKPVLTLVLACEAVTTTNDNSFPTVLFQQPRL